MLSDKAYLTLTIGTSVVIVAVVALTGGPWLTGALICLPIILGGLLAKRQIEDRRPREEPQQVVQYQPPPPPAPPASTGPVGLALPSLHQDYRFLLNATVLWRQSGAQGVAHPRPAQLAVDAVRERASRFTEGESAANTDLLGPRLALDLSFPRPDRTGQLEVWAQDVALAIPEDDRRRLAKLAEVRKDEEVWEHERAYERNKRAYLRQDVLSSTGSAVVWWLAQDTRRIEETVALIGTFAELVAAAQDREVQPVFRLPITGSATLALDDAGGQVTSAGEEDAARLIEKVLPDASEPERAELADRFATLAADHGAPDVARAIRERFNAPDFVELGEPDLHPNGQGEHDPT
ncbi:hypothetical protein [Actinophytocola sp.]|uniref:hypothetical protein n=1 Tax=Actinophytocola sp. TaxID=1872138 RepID=UPI003899B37C